MIEDSLGYHSRNGRTASVSEVGLELSLQMASWDALEPGFLRKEAQPDELVVALVYPLETSAVLVEGPLKVASFWVAGQQAIAAFDRNSSEFAEFDPPMVAAYDHDSFESVVLDLLTVVL